MACECRQETRRDKRRARCKDSTLGGAGGAPPSHMTNTRQLSIWLSINQGLPKQPSKKYTNVRIFQMHLTHRHTDTQTHRHTDTHKRPIVSLAQSGSNRPRSIWFESFLVPCFSLSPSKNSERSHQSTWISTSEIYRAPSRKGRRWWRARARAHTLTQNNNNDNNKQAVFLVRLVFLIAFNSLARFLAIFHIMLL